MCGDTVVVGSGGPLFSEFFRIILFYNSFYFSDFIKVWRF